MDPSWNDDMDEWMEMSENAARRRKMLRYFLLAAPAFMKFTEEEDSSSSHSEYSDDSTADSQSVSTSDAKEHEAFNVETLAPVLGRGKRDTDWTAVEDEALCNAWVTVSQNGAIRICQSSDTFWDRVYAKFNENVCGFPVNEPRSRDNVECRWKIIDDQCSLWASCVSKVERSRTCGFNLADLDVMAETFFRNDVRPTGKPFRLQHAWKILEHCPKWNVQVVQPPSSSQRVLFMPSSGANETSPVSISRPAGRDKQKVAKKKVGDSPHAEFFARMREMMEENKERDMFFNRESLNLMKRQKEQQLLSLDLSKFSEAC